MLRSNSQRSFFSSFRYKVSVFSLSGKHERPNSLFSICCGNPLNTLNEKNYKWVLTLTLEKSGRFLAHRTILYKQWSDMCRSDAKRSVSPSRSLPSQHDCSPSSSVISDSTAIKSSKTYKKTSNMHIQPKNWSSNFLSMHIWLRTDFC